MGQCAARTKDGDRCKIETREGEKYCYIHKKQRRRRVIAIISSMIGTGLVLLGVLADITGLLDFFGIKFYPTPAVSASESSTMPVSATVSTTTVSATLTPTPPQMLPISEIAFEDVEIIDTHIQGFVCGYGKQHSVIRENNGVLHIFYRPYDDENALLEATSYNGGKTWENTYGIGIDAPTGLGGMRCSSVIDSTNTLYLVFGLPASDAFYTYKAKGSTWTEPVVRGQGDPAAGVFASDIALGPNDSVHLIWSSKRLWYSYLAKGKWVHEVVASPGGWHPDIDVDSQGVRHVVFNDAGFLPTPTVNGDSYSPVEVRYTFSENGREWSNPVVVNTSDDLWTGDANIKVDATGRRHVTYIRDAKIEGDLYYTYSDDGEAWSLPYKLNEKNYVPTGITGNESSAMIIDRWGNVFVFWQGITGNGKSYLYLRWLDRDKNSWSDQIEIRDMVGGLGLASTPSVPFSIVSDYQDRFIVDVVWSETTGIVYGKVIFTVR